MLNPIEINFKLDKTIKRALTTELMIKSHDINVIEFHISFDGLELTADHTVKVLSVFNDSQSQTNVNCEIEDGKAIYRPDTSIISQYEYAQNYVYLYHGDKSLDVRLFTYIVDSSEIDKTAIKVKTVYDQSYAELLTEFEARLQDYKDSLPQASDLRAEVDAILDKFKVDSDAKLRQYDADAQQAIADNQTAFDLAEGGRQSTYEQAEDIRNQASNQAVVDWEQSADAIINIVEDNETARVDAEATRKTAETDRVSSEATRKTNETTRVSNENERELAEDIRIANEDSRVTAENVRSEFYDGFNGEIATLKTEVAKKANKKQEDWITPTLLNGWYAIRPNEPPQYMMDEFGFVHFRGSVSKGASATSNVAFQLPTGYRPSVITSFGMPAIGASGMSIAVSISVGGNVDFAGAPSNTWYGISYITFKAV